MSKILQRLQGKVAVVTASTDGIGYAIAERLAQEGARLVVSSRKEKNVKGAVDKLTSQGLDVTGVVCHVGNQDHRRQLINESVKKYGKFDVLVSNAAVNPGLGPILNVTEEQYDKMLDINIKATFFLIKEAVLHMNTGGNIIIVGSAAGYTTGPFQNMGIYAMTKTALLGLTKALVPQLSTMGLRVNCLSPGLIKTRFSESLRSDEANFEKCLEIIAMHRMGAPSECAAAAAFLASDDASYITGESLVASGGVDCRL